MLLKMPHRRLLFPLTVLLCWERNNFDRVVHFSYGLLLAYPVREVLQRDFATEWNESLRVKNSRPLGEDETRRLLNRRDAA